MRLRPDRGVVPPACVAQRAHSRVRAVCLRGECGAAAAELAVTMPVVTAVIAVIVISALSGVQLVKAAALAGDVARSAARGEPDATIDEAIANSGLAADVDIDRRDGAACATVRAAALGADWLGVELPGVTVCSLNVGL